MLRRLSRISLVLVLMLSSEVWALGLGEIRLDSALNEPLRAEIELLSATAEELSALRVTMASSTTFERYGLDRPVFLQDIEFMVIGNVVEVRSRAPVTEPFVTFLVEAAWTRGRLLREYTLLLDPPTFAPPTQAQQPVSAPQRSAPSDSGRIERAPPAAATPKTEESPAPVQTRPPTRSEPVQQPESVSDERGSDDRPYSSGNGNNVNVERGDTLWGIAQRFKPDGRLTTNQTMLAIYAASPEAFGGNINLLRAGATLRIPSANEIFQISRDDALDEVKRQNSAWGYGSSEAAPVDATPRPSLTLVPPDEDVVTDAGSQDFDSDIAQTPLSQEQEVEQAISRLEAQPVPDQPSLIEIRDNELAALRDELARIRDDIYGSETVDETIDETIDDTSDATVGEEEPFEDSVAEDATVGADDVVADEQVDDAADTAPTTGIVTTRSPSEPGFVDKILGALTSAWAGIIGALVLVVGLLIWFMRRGGTNADETDSWNPLDADEMSSDQDLTATETLRAPIRGDESFLVVEQDSAIRPMHEDTIETRAPDISGPTDSTRQLESIDDTFSAETAINLDQSDPIAEADFHMAYGLYDQAADLINGGLDVEPERQDLLTKLCEIYFVWGNRDAFVDAAGRLRAAIGGSESADWDKIVIMGHQIAGDHALFAGAGMAAATKVVDLAFDSDTGENAVLDLDMELGSDEDDDSVIIDLGMEDPGGNFMFGGETGAGLLDSDDAEEIVDSESTVESPTIEEAFGMIDGDDTVESPTIEEQFDILGGTAELPSLDSTIEQAAERSGLATDETAEINLDDLGLDISGLAETEIASLDDLDATSETAIFDDPSEATGKNPEIDPNSTGVRRALSGDATGMMESLADMDIGDISGTNATLNLDSSPADTVTEHSIDESLLDATGMTQVLDDDFTVEATMNSDLGLSDAEATLLAPGYGDDDDFDFAKTEALSSDAFTGISNLDETGEMPSAAGSDFDMDLDDLTAALKVSASGDTVDQPRDDATIEQRGPNAAGPGGDTAETVAIAPGGMHGDLHDARTMTEVGTKLDLARAYVDMGDPAGARSILEEVLDEGDESQRQQAQKLLDSLA